MGRGILICWCLILIACGKHDSTNYGIMNNSKGVQGEKAETPLELFFNAIQNGVVTKKEDRDVFFKTMANIPDINVRFSNGRTPLIQAANSGKAFFVYEILRQGADRTLVDNEQKTAMDHAIENENEQIQIFLDEAKMAGLQATFIEQVTRGATGGVGETLNQGVNPNFLTADGETPLLLALKTFEKQPTLKYLKTAAVIVNWVDETYSATTTDVNFANSLGEKPLVLVQRLLITIPNAQISEKLKTNLLKALDDLKTDLTNKGATDEGVKNEG